MSKNIEKLQQSAWEFASNFPPLPADDVADIRAQLVEALQTLDDHPEQFMGIILSAGFKNGDEGVNVVGMIAGTTPALYACSLMSREVSREVGDALEADGMKSKLKMMSLADKVAQLDSAEGLRDLLSGANCDCPSCRAERAEAEGTGTIH